MRKIIQIDTVVSEMDNIVVLSALCDDGTVWQKNGRDEWALVPKISQDEPQE